MKNAIALCCNHCMQILIFAGSTRQDSYNRKLATVAASIAEQQGAQPSLLELSDYDIPLYNADLEAQGTPADVIRLKQAMHSHAAWIVCSPEYNGSYPALLKNAIDWASSPVKGDAQWSDGVLPFRNKVVGMASASPGGLGGLRAQSHRSAAIESGMLGSTAQPCSEPCGRGFRCPGSSAAYTEPARHGGSCAAGAVGCRAPGLSNLLSDPDFCRLPMHMKCNRFSMGACLFIA